MGIFNTLLRNDLKTTANRILPPALPIGLFDISGKILMAVIFGKN
jgi:hypothetical protein